MKADARSRQRGVALLVVLLIVAMMTTVAVAMSDRLFVNFQRAERQLRYQQAFWYSQGVEALAEVGLKESFKDNDKVTLNQPWAVKDQTYPLDLGTATGSVYDRQACYNVNALNNVGTPENGQLPYEVAVLQRLFENLELDGYQAETAAASVWEFVDGDNSVQTALGVEDSHYEARQYLMSRQMARLLTIPSFGR